MPFSPKQRQGGKEVDTSLYVVASSMGVEQSELEKLLAGQASVGIAKIAGGEQDGPAKVYSGRGEHDDGLRSWYAATPSSGSARLRGAGRCCRHHYRIMCESTVEATSYTQRIYSPEGL